MKNYIISNKFSKGVKRASVMPFLENTNWVGDIGITTESVKIFNYGSYPIRSDLLTLEPTKYCANTVPSLPPSLIDSYKTEYANSCLHGLCRENDRYVLSLASGFTTNKIVGDGDTALVVNSSTILDYIGQASSKLCVNGMLTPDSFICIPSPWYSIVIKGLIEYIGDNVMCYPDLHYAIATGGVPKIYGLNVLDSPMYEIESDTVNVLYGSPGAIGNVAHIWRDESSVVDLVYFLRYGARIMNEAHGGYIKLKKVLD